MNRNARLCFAIVAATLTVAGCASSLGGQAPDPSDLALYSGDWVFDPEASRRSEFHYWTRDPVTDDEPPQSVQDELLTAVEHWPTGFTLESDSGPTRPRGGLDSPTGGSVEAISFGSAIGRRA